MLWSRQGMGAMTEEEARSEEEDILAGRAAEAARFACFEGNS